MYAWHFWVISQICLSMLSAVVVTFNFYCYSYFYLCCFFFLLLRPQIAQSTEFTFMTKRNNSVQHKNTIFISILFFTRPLKNRMKRTKHVNTGARASSTNAQTHLSSFGSVLCVRAHQFLNKHAYIMNIFIYFFFSSFFLIFIIRFALEWLWQNRHKHTSSTLCMVYCSSCLSYNLFFFGWCYTCRYASSIGW